MGVMDKRVMVWLMVFASGYTAADTNQDFAEANGIRAQLIPHQYTTIAAEIGARINRLPTSEGGAFNKGDVLVGFDCTSQGAMLQRSKAEHMSAQALYQANQQLAGLNAVGEVELVQSRAAVDKFAAEVASQRALLSKCTIKAPFNGRVAAQLVREQQYVQPGEPLLEILDDSVLELGFLVPSRWLAWIKLGDTFEVLIEETEKRYPARFVRVAARVDAVSQSVKVVAVIDGQFPELLSGMSGQALIQAPRKSESN